MTSNTHTPRRTAVYVDGYNLYYGRLRGTAFKWLDLVKLFDDLHVHRDQNETLIRVHLFTAPALATFASHGDASVEAQSAYHRALQAKYHDRFEIVYGTHSFDRSGTLLPAVMPIRPVASGMPAHRRPSGSLSRQADWTIAHLVDEVLCAAQLPAVVPTKKKPIRKPAHW